MVSEHTIDKTVDALESADFEREVEYLSARQPELVGYLFSEDFDLLTQDERSYMLYLTLVLYQSVEAENGNIPPINASDLESAEENNWELLENITEKRFRERITVFFEKTKQEDLLAFIEDALTDDEDNMVTPEGREPVFVALKSIVDAITKEV